MLFQTYKKENRRSRFIRSLFNFSPTYRGSRGWVTFIAEDFSEVHVKMNLNLFTRNYVGSIYGGSMYSSLDPFYMLMLLHILGNDYIVWDKAATISFLRPGKTRLKARFLLDDVTINSIKSQVKEKGESEVDLTVRYIDTGEKEVVKLVKTLYIADKKFYTEKRESKGQSPEFKKMF